MDKVTASGRRINGYYSAVGWSIGTTFIAALLLQLASSPFEFSKVPIFFRFIFFDDRFVLWLSVAVLGFALLLASRVRIEIVESLLAWIDRSILGISIASFVVFGLGAILFYHRYSLSMDEFSIVYQSKVFAAGKLDGQVSSNLIDRLVAPQFIIEFFGIDRARGLITAVYWPGTSLLMTPFTLLGVPWLLNPFISAITVYCLHRATREATGSPTVASWATLFLIASPVFAVSAASYYAMPSHMLANILYFWVLFRANTLRESGQHHRHLVFLAGVIGGFALVLHNPIPHTAFCAPWLVWIVLRRRDWILPIFVGYLVFALPLGVGWFLHLKTLDAQMPQLENSILARLPQIFVLPSSDLLTIRLLAIFKVMAWAVPGMLVLVFGAWSRRQTPLWLRLLKASFATLFIAYFFISYPQGHGWGYRFIHPAWFILPLLAAFALNHQVGEGEENVTRPHASRRQFFAAAIGLSLCILLPTQIWQVNRFITWYLGQIPNPPSDRKSILFIDPRVGYYSSDFVQNDPFLRDKAWKLIARGPASDLKFASQFLHSPRVAQQGAWGELIVEGE
ncbi:hypothetical protein EON83_05815 [bacterium]|nr:MAG: hypothetical protein EON83_05815 [bacterium]